MFQYTKIYTSSETLSQVIIGIRVNYPPKNAGKFWAGDGAGAGGAGANAFGKLLMAVPKIL